MEHTAVLDFSIETLVWRSCTKDEALYSNIAGTSTQRVALREKKKK
jgi:hypothetical protein